MPLKAKFQKDLSQALKDKEEITLSVLRMLLAAVLNKEKEKRYKSGQAQDVQLADEEIVEVISSEIKKRRDAAELYERGGRQELAEKEKKELEILQKYLPEQFSEEALKKLIKEAIDKTGAKEAKDMARVMAELMSKVKGRAEGGLVSKIVRDLLNLSK